jgi:hypothetical protein
VILRDLIRGRYDDAGLPTHDIPGEPGFETECPQCGGQSIVRIDGEGAQGVQIWCESGCDREAVGFWLDRLTTEPSGDGPQPVPEPEQLTSTQESEIVLRALLSALPIDPRTQSLDPLEVLSGLPFLPPGATAQLAAPEGSGKSQLAQVAAYDVALKGGNALILAGEMPLAECATRARRISEARDGELTDAAVALWREHVAYADIYDVLPAIVRHAAAWNVVCADFDLIVLDAVSDAGAALGLKFARDNDDWLTFFQAFVQPCQGRAALLMLDNIGHAEDAHDRALGASAKGHKVDIRLWGKRREQPLSLVITCAKARLANAPFRRGQKWVAYADAYTPATVFDAEQIDLEGGEAPDPVAVVIEALQETSPQGQVKLVRALRAAGVKGRDTDLRDRIKALAADPESPVVDVGRKGFELDMSQGVSQGDVHGPYIGAGHGPPGRAIDENGKPGDTHTTPGPVPLQSESFDRTGGRDFSAWSPPIERGEPEDNHERKDLA